MDSSIAKKHIRKCGCIITHFIDGCSTVFCCDLCTKRSKERDIKNREKEAQKPKAIFKYNK